MVVLAAIIAYGVAWFILLKSTKAKREPGREFTLLMPVGIALHAWAASNSVLTESGVQFGFFQIASVLFVAMNLIVMLSALRKPIAKIYLILLPFSCIALLCAALFVTRAPLEQGYPGATVAHILLSIVAYSLLTIATLQAILLNYQNSQLKRHHVKSVLGIFPPLQTMESLLFDLAWAGFALLTLSIATGIFFMNDIFAQQLSHKTAFSVISWFIYAILLCGRHFMGWRGAIATRWVIAGFVMLMLAYFGSKFVIEFLLHS